MFVIAEIECASTKDAQSVHRVPLVSVLLMEEVAVVLFPIVTREHEINSFAQHMEVGRDASLKAAKSLRLAVLVYVLLMEVVVVVLSKAVISLRNLPHGFASSMVVERNAHMQVARRWHEVERNFVQHMEVAFVVN